MDKMLLSVPEAAEVIGVGRSVLYELLRDARLSSVTVGRRRLIPRASLIEFVTDLQRQSTVGEGHTE